MSDHDETKTVAAEVIGGDATGATTGVPEGEQPIVPRDKDGTALGNDHAVPDLASVTGDVDDTENRRLRIEDRES